MNVKTAIFDLDGTLHHTEKALVPAIQRAMADLGFEPAPPERINALYGEPLEVFCRELLDCDEDICSQFRKGIRLHQMVTLPEKGELYPGIRKMLYDLRDIGFNLAVCSNAGLDYIEFVTDSLGIADMFTLLEGRNGHASKSGRIGRIIESTGSGFSVMVGDRYHDIQGAFENGIPSIGCLYGYGSAEEMSDADHTVNSPSEIVGVIAGLLENISIR